MPPDRFEQRAETLRAAGRTRWFLLVAGIVVSSFCTISGRAQTGDATADARNAADSGAPKAMAPRVADAGLDGGGVPATPPVDSDSSQVPAADEPGGTAGAPEPPFSLDPLAAMEPNPALAPILEGPSGELPAEPPIRPGERSTVVIKTVLGLLFLLTLAYLGGHPKVLGWEERLGISQVITAGFPFVVLGMIARMPRLDILSDTVLAEISPLLRIGLGWIGFTVGFRFDTRLFQGMQPGTARIVATSTLLPFACVLGASGLVLALFDLSRSLDLRDPIFIRDALILGTAAAMTAHSAARLFSSYEAASIVSRIVRLEELAGVIGLAFVAAFFRPQGPDVSWQLPGTAWLLLTMGLGTMIGLLVYAILQRAAEGPDFMVLTLGSISLAAGAAGYLHLSSVVVAFVAGVLLANFPGSYHAPLRDMLLRLERPVYLLSLLIVGALWQVADWRGWILMPVFMLARLAGKWLATSNTFFDDDLQLSSEERNALAISPIGPLAVAIVINAQLLYPGGSISLIVSAVIGGGVLTEIFVQLAGRRRLRAPQVEPAPAAVVPFRSEGE